LVIFHSPEGGLLTIDTRQFALVRPVEGKLKEHVAPGTNAILYIGSNKIGITETREEAEEAIRDCVD
jgi:hypothetical protein